MAATAVAAAIGFGALLAPEARPALPCTAPASEQTVKSGIVIANGCFTKQGTVYSTTERLDLNGFTVAPFEALTIDTDPQHRQVSSGGEKVLVGVPGVGLGNRPMILDFVPPLPGAQTGPPTELTIGNLDLVPPALAGLLPQLGKLEDPIAIRERRSPAEPAGRVTFRYSLPGAFKIRPGIEASGTVFLDTFPQQTASFGGVDISASGLVWADTFGVQELNAHYTAIPEAWGGKLLVVFPTRFDKAGNVASVASPGPCSGCPPPPAPPGQPDKRVKGVGVGLEIEEGALKKLEVQANVNIEIQPQLFLTHVSGGFGLKPISAHLGAGLALGPELPSVLTGKDARLISGEAEVSYTHPDRATINGAQLPWWQPGRFHIGGKADLLGALPVGKASLDVYFLLADSSATGFPQVTLVSFSGGFGIGVPRFTSDPGGNVIFIGGRLDGWFQDKRFNLEGEVGLKVPPLDWDVSGAQGVISDRGIAACVKPIWWSPYIGGGLRWSDPKRVSLLGGWSSCGLGDYRDPDRPSAAAAAELGGGQSLELGPREQTLRLVGESGVPAFTLRSDDGRVIRFRARRTEPVFGDGYVIFSRPGKDTAYVLLRDPEASWSLAGEDRVDVDVARTVPAPELKGRVLGRGQRRKLRWRVRGARDGDKIRFEEVVGRAERTKRSKVRTPLRRPLFSTTEASGTRSFRPLPAFRRTHFIRALVLRDGAPMGTERVDSFKVALPRRPGRPHHLRARRNGNNIVAHWGRAPRAKSYVAVLEAKGGLSIPKILSARQLHVRFHNVPVTKRMRVRVFARNRLGWPSEPATDHFRVHPGARTAAQAASALVRSLRALKSGNLVVSAPCPPRGQCRVAVRVRSGGHVIGKLPHAKLIPNTRNRLRIHLRPGARRALLAGASLRVTAAASVAQGGHAVRRARVGTVGL